MTNWPPAARLGAQTPRVSKVPTYTSTAGPECVELAESVGLVLDPWQRYVLKHGLGERPDGKWAAFEVAVIVARQNGKGAIITARELGGLYLFGEDLILHSAHEFKTAAEGFRRVLTLINGSDDLRRRVKKVISAHGEEGIELLTGQRLRFIARSRGSGRGFSADTVILDEAFALNPDSVAAMLPTMSARPNPQIWYLSSAPLVDSFQLRKIQQRGRGPEPQTRLAYFEWSAPRDAALDDRDAWYQANPALGIRLSEEIIKAEREAMDDVSFARERLSIEEDITDDHLIPMDLWAELADRSERMLDPVCLAVDVTPERSASSIGAAGLTPAGLMAVDLVDHRPGTGWVVPRMTELVLRHRPCAVVLDERSAAMALYQDLVDAVGQRTLVAKTSTADLAEATAQFWRRIQPDTLTLRHPGHPALTAAVAGARKRALGGDGAWAFTRRDVTVDVSPLMAVVLAAWGHGKFRHRVRKPLVAYA